MTYNAAGQPLTVTNAKNETTTYTYESGTGKLLTGHWSRLWRDHVLHVRRLRPRRERRRQRRVRR